MACKGCEERRKKLIEFSNRVQRWMADPKNNPTPWPNAGRAPRSNQPQIDVRKFVENIAKQEKDHDEKE